ncbi:MAG TPA: BTAD domain-containing putative transcriptional regulator [Candidatus Dormibacteraeota bacterium]
MRAAMTGTGEVATGGATMVSVRLFDRFEVTVDGLPVAEGRWRLRKARDLVKLLALARGHRLHREQVMAVLWPDRDPRVVANNLHQVLHVTRRALDVSGAGGGGLMRVEGQMIALAPAGGVEVDVLAFEAAARLARREGTVAAYRAALALCTGEMLPEDRHEEWAEERRVVIAEERRDLLRRLVQAETAAGRRQEVVDSLHELVASDHDDDSARASLGLAGAAAGTVSDPLSFATPATAPPPFVANNLPTALSSFVGRELILTELAAALRSARLLTLSGPGGVGKTRLALTLARRCLDSYPDGAWLVELSSVARGGAVAGAVAEVLGVRASPGEPLLDALASGLRSHRTLLVLDTCEHVVADCARLAERLLSTCSALTILATSREPLRIGGEVVWRVPSLTTPDLDATEPAAVMQSEAARLLVDRARAVSPRFALTDDNAVHVAHVCRRLDGLPLAIELVAGRLAALGLDQLVDRLDHRLHMVAAGGRSLLTRQQTLRATVEWSHDLLTDAERITLRRLAVFVGGFDLEAAEDVCSGGPVVATDVLELVIRLVDKSLVDVEEVEGTIRYRLLDTIREYAVDKLREAGELNETAERHATWFLDLGRRVRQHLGRGDEAAWLNNLDPEQDNLRAALDHSLSADPERALGLAAAL